MNETEVSVTAPNGTTWKQPLGVFIDNEFIESKSGQRLATINPATETEIASVFIGDQRDVNVAVAAAQAALNNSSWSRLNGTQRGALLLKLATLIEENANVMASIETIDTGKPVKMVLQNDVAEASELLRFYAGYADKSYGQTVEINQNKMAYTIKEPVGVCGLIIPWNFPLVMALTKMAPALCCGNTVVLKPAELAPLSALYLASLIKEAGFPPGVVNVINGTGDVVGASLAAHPGVKKISFTGSTHVGLEVMKSGSVNMKHVTLETGGKSPLIVFEDADLNLAVQWAITGAYYFQGQVCTATTRIFVQDSIFDSFLDSFKEYLSEFTAGDPFDEECLQGPLIGKQQYDRVLKYIEVGKSEGALEVLGGGPDDSFKKGFYIKPALFVDVKPSMRIYHEEVFGPCVVLVRFTTEGEVVKMANETVYGLASAIFTTNLGRAHQVARRLEAGMVWINSSNDSDIKVPFGGVKQSGIGRELGEAGLEPYYRVKAVHVNIGSVGPI